MFVMEQQGNFRDAEALILCNVPGPKIMQAVTKAVPLEKRVLFLFEPPSTDLRSYNAGLHAQFKKVYTWDDDLVDGKTYFKFYYPVLRKPMLASSLPFKQKKLCTMIARNKCSKHPGELYSKRCKAICYFEHFHPNDFDLYGQGWPGKIHKTFRGAIEDKASVLARYRFSICYENMTSIRGYITEKIFDCFYAGCVPIYWGASNVEDYIPAHCFIDKRKFKTWTELYSFLKNMTEAEHQQYLDNIRAYLDSAQSYPFTPEAHAELLRQAITEMTSTL